MQRTPDDITTQRNSTIEKFGNPTSNSIPTIVRLIKSSTTKQINIIRNKPCLPVWQRNYYERIIRDDNGLDRVRKYIANNPANWITDKNNSNIIKNNGNL